MTYSNSACWNIINFQLCTYSGADLGAVDDDTRSLDSFFFGVLVAITIKMIKVTFL